MNPFFFSLFNPNKQANEQSTSYRSIAGACRQASPRQDLAAFVKAAQQQVESQANNSVSLLIAQNNNSTNSNNLVGANNVDFELNGHLQQENHCDNTNDSMQQQQQQQTTSTSSHSSKMATIIRYHHFQAPNAQLGELEGSQFDPKSRVSLRPIFACINATLLLGLNLMRLAMQHNSLRLATSASRCNSRNWLP